MNEHEDMDAIAGEYVLGTLDAQERADVAARRHREPDLDVAIIAWEAQLGPLIGAVASAEPSAGLFAKIEQLLEAGPRVASTAKVIEMSQVSRDALRRQIARWKASALAASALAASLIVGIVVRELNRAVPAPNYVAVFQKDDVSPAFVLSVDVAQKVLSIRRVGAEMHPGHTYELWIAHEGSAPRSLGLVDEQDGAVGAKVRNINPVGLQNASFGVSLEPNGGSPSGKPTGPVLHARLIPTGP